MKSSWIEAELKLQLEQTTRSKEQKSVAGQDMV